MPPHLSERLTLRISPEDLYAIAEAALIKNTTISEFIRSNSLGAAHEVICEEAGQVGS